MKEMLKEQVRELATRLVSGHDEMTVPELKAAVKEIYDKLVVLEYLEDQLAHASGDQKVSLDSKSFREENWFVEPEPVPRPENKDELVEPVMEKIKDIVAQMPGESQNVDELLETVLPEKKVMKNDLEEFASQYQEMPTFERKTEVAEDDKEKKQSINERNHHGLSIGLNDRLAFIKHLFNGNAQDYSRVLSQIGTLNSYDEAATYIRTSVIPDYRNWHEKEEYAERFLNIIQRSFE